jgi:hypothetical protein
MEQYLNWRKRYLEEYTTEHPQLLQECQNALQTGNTTRRVFWWNQTLTNTDTSWCKPKRQDKMSIPWHLRFFLSQRGFLMRGVYLFSSPSPFYPSKKEGQI